MQEININVPKPKEKEIVEPSLAQKVDTLWNDANNVIKRKPLKLPRRAKVKKRRAKKGWIGVVKIDENNNASGEKVLLRDSAFKTRDELIHATNGSEIIMWDGKFPLVIQEAKKVNPKNFHFNEGENETYGQPYIRAKMLQEAIKPKRGGMGIILWFIGIGVAIFLIYKLISGN